MNCQNRPPKNDPSLGRVRGLEAVSETSAGAIGLESKLFAWLVLARLKNNAPFYQTKYLLSQPAQYSIPFP